MTITIEQDFGKRLPRLSDDHEGSLDLGDVIRGLVDDIDGVSPAKPNCYDNDDLLEYFKPEEDYGVIDGLLVVDPTTGSSQVTGDGNTTWNVDIQAGAVVIDGVEKVFDATADHAVHSGSELMDEGESVYAAVIAKNDSGTITLDSVVGTPATDGDEEIVEDADITSDVGHEKWIPLAMIHLNRDGDESVAQTQANRYRSLILGAKGTCLLNLTNIIGAVYDYSKTILKG